MKTGYITPMLFMVTIWNALCLGNALSCDIKIFVNEEFTHGSSESPENGQFFHFKGFDNSASPNENVLKLVKEKTTSNTREFTFKGIRVGQQKVIFENLQKLPDGSIKKYPIAINVCVLKNLTKKQNLLLEAVRNNNVAEVHKLLKQGINPNYGDANNNSLLHFAVINRNLDIIADLMSLPSIKTDIKNDLGETPLDFIMKYKGRDNELDQKIINILTRNKSVDIKK